MAAQCNDIRQGKEELHRANQKMAQSIEGGIDRISPGSSSADGSGKRARALSASLSATLQPFKQPSEDAPARTQPTLNELCLLLERERSIRDEYLRQMAANAAEIEALQRTHAELIRQLRVART